MRKLFKKLWSSLLDFLKIRWAYLLSIIFIWLIPLIMLNEQVAFVEKVRAGFKITFMGCLVLLVMFFAVRKKIYAWINKKPHGIIRGVLLCINKIITYGLLLGVLWAVSKFSGILYNWWLLSGISWIFGLVFLMIDEYLTREKIDERN